MAIKSYVPKKSTVIDRRSTDGGYYVAECEICGREFYPKRSNAKFCSNVCGQRAHRNTTLKKSETTVKPPKQIADESLEWTGAIAVYRFLQKKYNTRGDKAYILSNLKGIEKDDTFKYGKHVISKISTLKFIGWKE